MTDIIFVLFIVGASVCVLLMAAICIYAVIEIGRQEDLIEKENPGYFND